MDLPTQRVTQSLNDLTVQARPEMEKQTGAIDQWKALVVSNTDTGALLGGEKLDLPTELVRLPVNNMPKIAIVSWRWDGHDRMYGSRNAYEAIKYARRAGIEYLLIDVVSIDQQIDSDNLIKQVIAFSELYNKLPVIASYGCTS